MLLYIVGHQTKDIKLEWGMLEHGELDLPKFKLVSESKATVEKHYTTGKRCCVNCVIAMFGY